MTPAHRLTRRQVLAGAAGAAGAVGLGGLRSPSEAATKLPEPSVSGIDHIVVLMMENRSFDHYLGWLKGADGKQAGLRYVDRDGVPHKTHHLTDYQGCAHPDPDHSYEGGRVEFNGGRCDGWLRAGANDEYAIGYYAKRDLAFLGPAATQWTTCDRYFSAVMAGTFANRLYQHCAQTDRVANTLELSTLPTIWDRLAAAGLDGRYYFSDLPFLLLWGGYYIPIARSFDQFLVDAAAGTLPHVAFVEPRFFGAGVPNDDHPFADIRNGQAFLNLVYTAITNSPAWPTTVLVINYDEWGGFFDHVPPRPAPIPPADVAAGNQDGLRGFRVPCLVVSPFARRDHVSSLEVDHTSVLRMIEWRWGLPPLTVRDETANNLADVLDFSAPRLRARQFDVPAGPFGAACIEGPAREQWQPLFEMAADHGWLVSR